MSSLWTCFYTKVSLYMQQKLTLNLQCVYITWMLIIIFILMIILITNAICDYCWLEVHLIGKRFFVIFFCLSLNFATSKFIWRKLKSVSDEQINYLLKPQNVLDERLYVWEHAHVCKCNAIRFKMFQWKKGGKRKIYKDMLNTSSKNIEISPFLYHKFPIVFILYSLFCWSCMALQIVKKNV